MQHDTALLYKTT